MGEILEIAKTLVSPAEKLIDVVQSAIGKAYEPRHIKKLADAKAYEITSISNAMRNASDIPIRYDRGNTTLSTEEYDSFVRRTQSRMAFQELTKQRNIEAVANNAYTLLCGYPNISNEQVDCDWINTFFDSVAYISNEQMQLLWGKILAGEVIAPGSFSMRTLGVVRQLTSIEAKTFEKICPLILKYASENGNTCDDYFLPDMPNKTLETKYSILYSDIMRLDEAGLISSNSQVFVEFDVVQKGTGFINSVNKSISINNLSDIKLHIQLPVFALTKVGQELCAVILPAEVDTKMADEYLEDCIQIIKTYGVQNNSGFEKDKIISLSIVDSN